MTVRVSFLGESRVVTSAGDVVGLAPRQRAVLARLAQTPGVAVSVDRLLHDVWGDQRPASGQKAVAFQVKKVRDAIDPDRTGDVVRTASAGYALDLAPESVDVHRVARLVSDARSLAGQDPVKAGELIDDALGAWRGSPYADVPSSPWLDDEIRRLEQLQHDAERLRAQIRLALGDAVGLVPDLRVAVADRPLDSALVASLMLALHHTDRTADALAVYADHRQMLAEELGLDPPARLVALEAAILRDDRSVAAPVAALTTAAARTNLPAATAALVGRDDDVVRLRNLLVDERLVTVTGPGGVGKTALAEHLGQLLRDQHRDGAWLVRLDAIAEPRFLLSQVADALRLRAGEGVSLRDVVLDHLATRDLLLVVDNCEHLVEPVASLVEDLLRGAPDLRVLTTSRSPLGIAGEVGHVLAPLDLDDGGDASRLFVERMRAVRGDVELTDQTAAAIDRLCRLVGGLPLGIELAAVRTRSASPAEIADRLATSRDPLRGRRGTKGRRSSLDATIAWSHDLLDEDGQTLLKALSVTAGGFDTDLARALAPEVGDVADTLDALVEDSLLSVTHTPDLPTRFTLLEPIRQFAARRLETDGARAAVRTRHADAMADHARRAEPGVRGAEQQHVDTRLREDRANLRAAARTLLDDGRLDDLLDLAWNLYWHWQHDSRHVEGLATVAEALEQVDAGASADPSRVARGWMVMSMLALDISLPEAVAHADRAVAIARGLDDPALLGQVLLCRGLAVVNTQGGDGRDALDEAERVLATAPRTWLRDPAHDEGVLEFWRAWARNHDDTATRRARFDRAAEIFAEVGDRMLLAGAQMLTILLLGGDPETDAWIDRSLDAAVVTARRNGSDHQLGHALLFRHQADAWFGRQDLPIDDLDRAAGLFDRIGDRACWGTAASLVAAHRLDAGDVRGAADRVTPMLRVVARGGFPVRRLRALAVAAVVALEHDERDLASVLLAAADTVTLPAGVVMPDVDARLAVVREAVAEAVLPAGGVAAVCDAFVQWHEALATSPTDD